jgi:hypothetical protein
VSDGGRGDGRGIDGLGKCVEAGDGLRAVLSGDLPSGLGAGVIDSGETHIG